MRLLSILLLVSLGSFAQQWHQVTTIPAPYASNYWLDVFFLPSDPRYGWICGFNGMVIRTTDGGRTWQGTQIPGANQLESIHFVTPLIGYTSGPDGIWRTTDGGATWTNVTPDSAFTLWGCYFLSPSTGVVIGGGCGSTPQRFFRTTDGGTTWTFFTGNEPNSGLTDAILFPNGTGFAVSSGRLWRTTDSGQSWTVFSTTGSAVWQEELTHVGNSFLLPFAGITCGGQGNAGGMRFSTDGGTTWREFSTGRPMFGAFLLNPTTGWACGYSGALYYTTDGGQTWQLRNCGIDTTRHLDDIWFVNDTLGWVVGQGVWRYGPPDYRFDRDSLLFPDVCLPGSIDQTVRLANGSFTQTMVTLSITGPNATAFRLVNFPPTALLQPCSWSSIPLRFEPLQAGLHRAELIATFPDGTVRRLLLLGIGREKDGFPERDTLLLSSVPCGVPTTAQLRWFSRDSAAIVRIDWIGGSAGITLTTAPPLAIPRTGTALTFSVLLNDTGWAEARFRVRLQPCLHDTVIVVRAYGRSPILTAPNSRSLTLRCQLSRLDSIPITNTGNDTLRITRFWIDQTPAGTLSVLGWKSGQSFPAQLPPHTADTLLLSFQPPAEGPFTATLWLENNDSTKVRGPKNPFALTFSGEARRSALLSEQSSYDFGRVCIGERQEIRIRLANHGTLTAFLSQPRVASPFAAELEDRRNPPLLLGGDTLGLRIRFSPAWEGVFRDTVVLTATPCGERIAIAVSGEGIRAALQAIPPRLQENIPAAEARTLSLQLLATGSAHVRVDRYRWDPPAPSWLRLREPTPGTWLQSGQSWPLVLELTPTEEPATYSGTLCLESDAECPTALCIPVTLQRTRLQLAVERIAEHWQSLCTPLDTTARVLSLSNPTSHPVVITAIAVDPPSETFQLIELPPMPFALEPASSLTIRLRIRTVVEGQTEATLRLVLEDSSVLTFPLRAEFYRSRLELLSPPVVEIGSLEPCEAERVVLIPVLNDGQLTDTVAVELQSESSAFRLQGPSSIVLPGGSTDTVRVVLSPAALPDGETTAMLYIRTLLCPTVSQVRLVAIGIHPRLRIQPAVLDWDTVWLGEQQWRTLRVENPSPVPLRIDAISVEPPTAGFTVEAPPLPLLLPAGQELPLTLSFTAADSGHFHAELRIVAHATCPLTTTALLRASVPPEVYALQLWIEHHVARAGDTVYIPLWLRGATQRAQVEELTVSLQFDPAVLLPLALLREGFPVAFSYDGGGILYISTALTPEASADAVTPQPVAVLVGQALASIPSETPLHFLNATVVARRQTVLSTTDGRLSVLFCGSTIRRIALREGAWAMAVATDEGIRVQVFSPERRPWTLRLSTTDGRLCWSWHGAIEGGHDILIPGAMLAQGSYLLWFHSNGQHHRPLLVPWIR